MKLLKKTWPLIGFFILFTSCIKNEPVTNDMDSPKAFKEIQSELFDATSTETPESIETGEFAFFSDKVRFFSGEFQTVGYRTYDVLEKNEDNLILEDGTPIPLYGFKVLDSAYKVEENGEATLETRIERSCRFVRDPYFLWLESCELQPFQDAYVYLFYGDTELPYFYNFKKRQMRVPLPKLMVDNNVCFGNSDCTIQVTEIEFDIILNKDGKRERQHILLWLTKDLPYLASNPRKCISTLVEYQGGTYPYEYCQELVNFIPTP